MNEVILISVQPEWVQKILQGKKTIEVRKTKPNCLLPIDVYIYCTHGSLLIEKDSQYWIDISNYKTNKNIKQPNGLNGKVVAKFTLSKVDKYEIDEYMGDYPYLCDDTLDNTSLTREQLREYGEYYKPLYCWHIDNLVIFDGTMKLEDFSKNEDALSWTCKGRDCDYYYDDSNESNGKDIGCSIDYCPVTRPPQSWQYSYLRGVD